MNDIDQQHFDNVRTIVLDGNRRYHVVTDGKVTYTGNNVLLFWYWKLKGRKGRMSTTIKYG